MRSFFIKLFKLLRIKHRHPLGENAPASFAKMASKNYISLPNQTLKNSFTFFAIGDAGAPTNELKETALAMDTWSKVHSRPDMVLGLGDNFYKVGVSHVSDPHFKRCWSDVFLKYESLRVPWRMILGNHDYMGIPQAQIDFHYDRKYNPDGHWQLPSTCYNFDFSVQQSEDGEATTPDNSIPSNPDQENTENSVSSFNVSFFGLDTNGCQKHVARIFPSSPEQLKQNIAQLDVSLQNSTSEWKIVFGHHPCYSQGLAHGTTGQCLRQANPDNTSTIFGTYNISMPDGFGLEDVLAKGGADAYFCAHEHVFQAHTSEGVHHFMCGASGSEMRHGSGLYEGAHDNMSLDWVASGQDYGFVACTITSTTMCVQFISAADNSVLREINIRKQ